MNKTLNDLFVEMRDTLRQIDSLACLLRVAAENEFIADLGEDVTEDAARVISEKAHNLGEMLQAAQDAAKEGGAE